MRKKSECSFTFSSIAGFKTGLENFELDVEVVFASEIDIHATNSYLANFVCLQRLE